jgi:hypothetical protein
MDRLYERLTPTERFQIAVAAFGRGDLAEVDRLNDTTPYRTVKIQDPAYFDRLQRIIWLALYVAVQARNQEAAAVAVYAALVLNTLRADDLEGGDADENDAKFEELCRLCVDRISRLKALSSAWETFCTGLGVSASDIDKMMGLPILGSGGALELIEVTIGEVATDETYERECLDHMTGFWDRMIRDRHPK